MTQRGWCPHATDRCWLHTDTSNVWKTISSREENLGIMNPVGEGSGEGFPSPLTPPLKGTLPINIFYSWFPPSLRSPPKGVFFYKPKIKCDLTSGTWRGGVGKTGETGSTTNSSLNRILVYSSIRDKLIPKFVSIQYPEVKWREGALVPYLGK